ADEKPVVSSSHSHSRERVLMSGSTQLEQQRLPRLYLAAWQRAPYDLANLALKAFGYDSRAAAA
ncbi:MAG: hypothetical protein ACXVDI_26395, partial [Ktedonobacterales bacterium]